MRRRSQHSYEAFLEGGVNLNPTIFNQNTVPGRTLSSVVDGVARKLLANFGTQEHSAYSNFSINTNHYVKITKTDNVGGVSECV